MYLHFNILISRFYIFIILCSLQITFNCQARGLTINQLENLDPKKAPTSQLLDTCRKLLSNDQYKEAIPFLNETIIRLNDSSDKSVINTLSFTIFQLADCYMKVGDYFQAANTYSQFADQFVQDPQKQDARLLSAKCYTLSGLWSNAEVQVNLLLNDTTLNNEIKQEGLRILAESCFEQKKWEDVIQTIKKLSRFLQSEKNHSSSLIMLTTSYTKLNLVDQILSILPNLNEISRNDLGLNLALLEAADNQYNKGCYDKALLLYQKVIPKSQLIINQKKRLDLLKSNIFPFKPGLGLSLTDHNKRQAESEKEFKSQALLLDQIRKFPEYDIDLMMRVAQTAYQLQKHELSLSTYKSIIEKNPSYEIIDESYYSIFVLLLAQAEWTEAKKEGYAYLEKYDQGLYRDKIILNLIQLHVEEEQFDSALRLGLSTYEQSLNYKFPDELRYLIGYSYFNKKEFSSGLIYFMQIIEEYSESSFNHLSYFWVGMTHLYTGRFNEAVDYFSILLDDDLRNSTLREEVLYRLGMSQYGAKKYDQAEKTFLICVQDYPNGNLISDVYGMIGDINVANEMLHNAIEYYDNAIIHAENMDQHNYPFFQRAKIWESLNEFELIIESMESYLNQFKDRADYVNAVLMSMNAHEAIDNYPEALILLLDTIEEYGGDADKAGVQSLQERLISDYRKKNLNIYKDIILEWVLERIEKLNDKNQIIAYRFYSIIVSLDNLEYKEYYLDKLLTESAVKLADPMGLSLIANHALEKHYYNLVFLAEEQILRLNNKSISALKVRLASLKAQILLKSYADIDKISIALVNEYGDSNIHTGKARALAGDAAMYEGKYKVATQIYDEILKNRSWRGSLTPEVLYNNGKCRQSLEQWSEAFMFFQRIFVLYGNYSKWVARAYLQSIICLDHIGEKENDMIKLYNEMKSVPELQLFPEIKEAYNYLKKLGLNV